MWMWLQTGKRVNKFSFYYYYSSRHYHAKQRAKMMKRLQEMGSNIAKSKMSPPKRISKKSDVDFKSFIWHKSSEIRKLLPKSPHKSVTILKHMWDQCYKSPLMHHCMHQYWDVRKKNVQIYVQSW